MSLAGCRAHALRRAGARLARLKRPPGRSLSLSCRCWSCGALRSWCSSRGCRWRSSRWAHRSCWARLCRTGRGRGTRLSGSRSRTSLRWRRSRSWWTNGCAWSWRSRRRRGRGSTGRPCLKSCASRIWRGSGWTRRSALRCHRRGGGGHNRWPTGSRRRSRSCSSGWRRRSRYGRSGSRRGGSGSARGRANGSRLGLCGFRSLRGSLGFGQLAEMLAHEFSVIEIKRARVRLLLGNADLRKIFDENFRFDLELSRQFIDPNLIRVGHSETCFYSLLLFFSSFICRCFFFEPLNLVLIFGYRSVRGLLDGLVALVRLGVFRGGFVPCVICSRRRPAGLSLVLRFGRRFLGRSLCNVRSGGFHLYRLRFECLEVCGHRLMNLLDHFLPDAGNLDQLLGGHVGEFLDGADSSRFELF